MDAATRDDDARRAGATTTAIDGDDDDDGTRATTTTTTTTTAATATAVKTPTGRDDGDDGFCPAWTRRGRGTIASAAWRRPALAACSLEDFTFDLMRFHQERGRDWEQCWANLDRVVGRTGAPLDCLHLYRQVCSLGGFASRTSAKERIKAAEIFRNMFNHYENHTMTDCGNRMLTAYENYFLEYEAAHEEDLTRGTCGNCGGGIRTSERWRICCTSASGAKECFTDGANRPRCFLRSTGRARTRGVRRASCALNAGQAARTPPRPSCCATNERTRIRTKRDCTNASRDAVAGIRAATCDRRERWTKARSRRRRRATIQTMVVKWMTDDCCD